MKKKTVKRFEDIEKRIEDGEVIVNFKLKKETYKTKVVGFNLSIGATFITTEVPHEYIFCSHGKLSQKRRHKSHSNKGYKEYVQYMKLLSIGIENGMVNWNDIEKEVYGSKVLCAGNPSSKTCAFNQ